MSAAGFSGWTYRECQQTDCVLSPLVPPVIGAILGAAADAGVELLLRAGGR
jgi:hypothetical protein